MIFECIEFHQYRCFIEGKVEFISDIKKEKNITLIEAPNGTGKTELLFAFWWVLYGEEFDFKTLQNKEATPYALNSQKYREIQNGDVNDKDECSITLTFSHEDKKYVLKRREEYKKTARREKLQTTSYLELYEINKYGQTQLPISNKEIITRRLEKIIPKKLLSGIIFDGERMQKISSTNEKSIEGIEGVINDVTSREIIASGIEEMKNIKKKYNQSIRKYAKTNDSVLLNLQEDIEKLNDNIESNAKKNLILDEKESKLQKKLNEISEELLVYESTKSTEEQYKIENLNLENEYKNYESKVDDLYAELNSNSAILLSDNLFKQIKESISQIDIPKGLNVEAIESILSKEKCICGTSLIKELKERLVELKEKLPPDNINSLLLETIRQKEINKSLSKKRLQELWIEIESIDQNIKNNKDKISYLRTKMSTSGIDFSKMINERINIEEELMNVKTEIKYNKKVIEESEKKLISVEKERMKFVEKYNYVKTIQLKIHYIDKCLKALEKIQVSYTNKALTEINKKIQDSYKLLSEDYEHGRNIYITQYTKQKFKIVTFYDSAVKKYIEKGNWESVIKYELNTNSNLTTEEKYEVAVLENAISNSTGQSKAVTISFIKAILDYSIQEKALNDEFEIQKSYPVVIDSPFGDLSGKNLTLPAQFLNQFSEQVILFLSPDSYKTVENYLRHHVGMIYRLEKINNMNYSNIIKLESLDKSIGEIV